MIRFEKFCICVLAVIASLMPVALLAQNKVMGQPIPFEEPLDQPNEREQRRFEQCSDCKKSKKEAWMVISDRDYNTVYIKPSFTAAKAREIGFREYYYVVDEEPDWIQIAKVETDGLKITKNEGVLGWVPKSKMLLWTTSMLNQLTKINQKVCLLNRADASQDITNLEKVDISRGPGDRVYNKEPELNIYSFHFSRVNRPGVCFKLQRARYGASPAHPPKKQTRVRQKMREKMIEMMELNCNDEAINNNREDETDHSAHHRSYHTR